MYSDVSVVSPPECEPLALAQAKAHCRIDNTYDDLIIPGYITTARMLAEAYLNRALITQTLQWVMAQEAPPTGNWPLVPAGPLFVLPLWFNWADVGGCWLELPHAPTQSVISVAQGVWGQTPDTALVAGTDYWTDLTMQPGRIKLAAQATNAQSHVVVQFEAGYGDTSAAVPQPICTAIGWITAWLYENRGDTDAAMPKGAINMLSPYRLATFG